MVDAFSAIAPNDKVLVFGGTGGVGQLTIGKLLNHPTNNYQVRTVSRRGQDGIDDTIFGSGGGSNKNNLEVVELDLLQEDTTALENAMKDVDAIVISVGTTAFPTMKWKGGNTPKAIDQDAIERIAHVATKLNSTTSKPKLKKIVLVTSVGVERKDQMPFVILNLFGVIDAKRAGEKAIMKASTSTDGNKKVFDYVIVRPGRLIGGPYTNEDLAKLFQIDGGSGTFTEQGDTLLGDCNRDGCADAVVNALMNDNCNDVAFSVISNEEQPWTPEEWTSAFDKL